MARILFLQRPDENEDVIGGEIRRRIVSSLLMADLWSSPGIGLPTEFRRGDLAERPIMDEVQFRRMAPGETPLIQQGPGIWYYKTKLVEIFDGIQNLNCRSFRDKLSQSEVDRQVGALAKTLDVWVSELPETRILNEVNIAAHRQNGVGAAFLDLHLGYNHYCVLLFFQYIRKSLPFPQALHPHAARCKKHALLYSSLLKMTRTLTDCRTVHALVGHMTVVSSAVLLFFLLSDSAIETRDAQNIRGSLLSNFETIVELQTYWPCLTQWVSEPWPEEIRLT